MRKLYIKNRYGFCKLVLIESGKVSGYMVAEHTKDRVYQVVRVVAESGEGLSVYKYMMQYLHTLNGSLTSSGDATNKGSVSVWNRIVKLSEAVAHRLKDIPSIGIPLYLNEDSYSLDDDSFLNNSYSLDPILGDFLNILTPCTTIFDDLVIGGEKLFNEKYYKNI